MMNRQQLKVLNEAHSRRASAVLILSETGQALRVVAEEDFADDPLSEALKSFLLSRRSGWVSDEGCQVFCRIYKPEPRLIVIGAVHITQALAALNLTMGYDLTIIDPREGFAGREGFRALKVVREWPEQALANAPLDQWSALVTLSHEPRIDDQPLMMAVKAGCFFIGALGSRRTHEARLRRLAKAGLSDEECALIEGPVGLDIGASEPKDIALSIMASIVRSHRRQGQVS